MEMGVPFSATLLLFCQFLMGSGFNIDLRYSILKEMPESKAYFGYSVAQHSETASSPIFAQILVGAPRAIGNGGVDGRTGALFKCPMSLTNVAQAYDCTELSYPDTSDLKDDYSSPENFYENKTNMWMGVNIRSAGAGKPVVACGHRYKLVEREVNVYGLGVCYNYNADLTVQAVKLPCSGLALVDQSSSISGEFGVCAAGMGLATADNDIIYGIPGARTWRGSASWYKENDFPVADIYDVLDLSPDNSGDEYTGFYGYLGSSAIIVRNLLNDRKPVALIGAPGEKDRGVVLIFQMSQEESDLVLERVYVGDQYKSGFGHSVAVVDIKNDQHPSMIVGAPYYRSVTDKEATSKRSEAGGAIYIYLNYGDGIRGNSSKVVITPGPCTLGSADQCANAQFGYSVTSVGDINGDGFHDIAVGAPFYGSGAVFFYNGQSNGTLATQPSQIIMASDLDTALVRPSRAVSGFGISLSGGHDMDGQGYADILVGAHASSHVVVLRTRPVITIKGAVKLGGGMLDPTNIECLSESSPTATCIEFETCFQASYSDAANKMSGGGTVTIKYTLTGDSGYEFPNNRRVVFDLSRKGDIDSVKTAMFTATLDGVERCVPQKIYVAYMQDLLKAVEFQMTTELVIPDTIQFDNINTRPILDQFGPSTSTAKIDFKRECKTRNCVTDLAVAAMFTDTVNVIPVPDSSKTSNNEFVFDSNKVRELNLTIKLNVDASLDQAYESQVYMFLGPKLWYDKVAYANHESTSCAAKSDQNYVVCSFGRAIPKGDERVVILTLGFDNLGSGFSTINITANTTSEDMLSTNDEATLQVKVNVVTDLELLGSVTRGDNVKYGGGEVKGASAMRRDDEIGDLVQHTYTIINSNGGRIPKATLTVLWPFEIASSGGYLLYLIRPAKILGTKPENGQCDVNPEYINKLGLELAPVDDEDANDVPDSGRRRKRAVDKNTAAVKTYESKDGSTRRIADLNCYDRTAKCLNITCEFFNIEPEQVLRVRFTSRLWNSSLTTDFGNTVDLVQVTSTGQLFIDPAVKVSQTDTTNDRKNVITEAQPDYKLTVKASEVPFWVYILAAVGGVIVLILIVLLLWKCGFFKRNRPTMHGAKVEKQKNDTATTYKQVPQSDPDHSLT